MQSYCAQLAFIHVEYYLYQSLYSLPEFATLQDTAPITGIVLNNVSSKKCNNDVVDENMLYFVRLHTQCSSWIFR